MSNEEGGEKDDEIEDWPCTKREEGDRQEAWKENFIENPLTNNSFCM